MVNSIESGIVSPPYFMNLKEDYSLSDKEIKNTLSKFFNGKVNLIKKEIKDGRGNKIYSENPDGYWKKWEYDERGNQIYWEDSDGHWSKWEYDERGNEIYHETSTYGIMLDKRK